jgi:hypothetical protein
MSLYKVTDPGDYYRLKGETANLLRDTIWRLKQLKDCEPYAVESEYQRAIDFLEKRLEMALYVGD